MKNRNKFYLIALCTLALCLALAGTASAESVTVTITGKAIAVVYEWVSSNEQVATVDEWGNVMPVAPGTVVISAYLQGELVAQHEMSVLAECAYCGGSFHSSATKHTTKWSKFDPDNHYQCLEEEMHHCDICDRDFLCSSWNSHTRCIACGKSWCVWNKGGHRTPPCGKISHRPCMTGNDDADQHKKCSHCGDYKCDGQSHGTAKGECSYMPYCTGGCGTLGVQHEMRPCKMHCLEYDDADHHIKCSHCGNFLCNGQSHGTAKGECSYVPYCAGGCGTLGVQHEMRPCKMHCVEYEGGIYVDLHSQICQDCAKVKCYGDHDHQIDFE